MRHILCDNPNEYEWEPDPQEQSSGEVVSLTYEDWPYSVTWAGVLVEYAMMYLYGPLPKAVIDHRYKERKEVTVSLESKKAELAALEKKYMELKSAKDIRIEVANIQDRIAKVKNKIYKLETNNILVSHLRQLISGVPDNGRLQIRDDNYASLWRNLNYNDIRVLMGEEFSKGSTQMLKPIPEKEKEMEKK